MNMHDRDIGSTVSAEFVAELICSETEGKGNGSFLRLQFGVTGHFAFIIFDRTVEINVKRHRIFGDGRLIDYELSFIRDRRSILKRRRNGHAGGRSCVHTLGRFGSRSWGRLRFFLRLLCRRRRRGFRYVFSFGSNGFRFRLNCFGFGTD